MEFVQNFTPPDFQVKNFTPSISPNFNSFSKKKHKKLVKMEKFTPLAKKFTLLPGLTGWTNFTSAGQDRTGQNWHLYLTFQVTCDRQLLQFFLIRTLPLLWKRLLCQVAKFEKLITAVMVYILILKICMKITLPRADWRCSSSELIWAPWWRSCSRRCQSFQQPPERSKHVKKNYEENRQLL